MRRSTAAPLLLVLSACMPPRPPDGGPGGPSGAPRPDPAAFAPKGVSPEAVPRREGFSAATRVGLTVYLSTQYAAAAPGAEPTGELLRGQADQVFRQLSAATLAAGALPADLARVTLYLRRMDEGELKVIRGAMQRWFPTDDPPALALVLVSDFPVAGALLGADGIVGVRPSAR